MKHKLIFTLLFSLFAATYSLHAQSASTQKLKADLQKKQQHGNELLARAHQQQQQAKNETRPGSSPWFQQPPSNTSKPTGQQPLLNPPNKKEDINQ